MKASSPLESDHLSRLVAEEQSVLWPLRALWLSSDLIIPCVVVFCGEGILWKALPRLYVSLFIPTAALLLYLGMVVGAVVHRRWPP